MKSARTWSLADTPPLECVERVTSTVLYTLSHSGWWSKPSAKSATRDMKPQHSLTAVGRVVSCGVSGKLIPRRASTSVCSRRTRRTASRPRRVHDRFWLHVCRSGLSQARRGRGRYLENGATAQRASNKQPRCQRAVAELEFLGDCVALRRRRRGQPVGPAAPRAHLDDGGALFRVEL